MVMLTGCQVDRVGRACLVGWVNGRDKSTVQSYLSVWDRLNGLVGKDGWIGLMAMLKG